MKDLQKRIINVGILDDNHSKITSIKLTVQEGVINGTEEKKEKYANIKLNPIEIPLTENKTIESIIEFIIDSKIEAIFVDYKLSSYENINFSGVDVAEEIENYKEGFPLFILTSYEDDLFSSEDFNPYKVIDYERYISEDKESVEINYKIIELVQNIYSRNERLERELMELLPKAGQSAEIDSRILELDTMIEKSLNKKHSIPFVTKNAVSMDRLDNLFKKLDQLLEEPSS